MKERIQEYAEVTAKAENILQKIENIEKNKKQ